VADVDLARLGRAAGDGDIWAARRLVAELERIGSEAPRWWFVRREPLGERQARVTLLNFGDRPAENMWGLDLRTVDDVSEALCLYERNYLLFNSTDKSMLVSGVSYGFGDSRKVTCDVVLGWTARCGGAGSRHRACGMPADHVENDGRAPEVCGLCAPLRRPIW